MDNDELEKIEEALTTAHKNFAKQLNYYAFFKIQNRDTCEDLVQNAFMKVWSYLVRDGNVITMKAFLYHILNDLIIDEYRKKNTISLDGLLEKGFEVGTDNSDRLFNTLDGKTATLLLDKLPEKYQKVMRMKYVQNLSLGEISLITGKKKNAIAVQTHRGLEKLKILHNAKPRRE